MRRLIVVALAIHSLACAAETKPKPQQGRDMAQPIKGDYYVYGGSLADSVPPTAKDRKISFMYMEPLAKELFGYIGPDVKNSCSGDPDYRERRRGHLTCIHTKSDGYTCYMGLDVPSGKSTHGVTC